MYKYQDIELGWYGHDSFLLRWKGKTIWIDPFQLPDTVPSDHIPEMNGLNPDIALVPVSGTYVMTAKEAVEAVKDINPKLAIPMHYGTIVGDESDATYLKSNSSAAVEILQKER